MSAVVLSGGKVLGKPGYVFNVGSGSAPSIGQYVGINLNNISYYSNEYPFLNILNQASASNGLSGAGIYPQHPWLTSVNDGTYNTNEEGWLTIDADQNPTSLVAGNGFMGTQVFNCVQTNIISNSANADGSYPINQTAAYPGGSYTFTFNGGGGGTLYLLGDVSAGATSTTGVTVTNTSGSVEIQSTLTASQTGVVVLTVTPVNGSGIQMKITSLPSATNYFQKMSLVQSGTNLTSYQAGNFFHPLFTAVLAPFSRLRFMDWMRTNTADYQIQFTGDLAINATSATLSSVNATGGSNSAWPFQSGSYPFMFANGQVISVTCVFNSTAVTWSTGLTSKIYGYNTGQASVIVSGTTHQINFNEDLSTGTTGGTLKGIDNPGALSDTPWPYASGVYSFVFVQGQTISVTCTNGSANVTFATALTSPSLLSVSGQAFVSYNASGFTGRPLLSNFSWAVMGVPFEAMIQLCNQVNADPWLCIPGTLQASSILLGGTTYATQLANLIYNGTGAVLTGSNLGSFSGLDTSQKANIEYMNEYWNFSFTQANMTPAMGRPIYANNYIEWFGSQLALIGQQFYAVYGATPFGSRVRISMSQQSTDTYALILAMNTPDWTGGAAYSVGHIGQIHTGGYFGLDNISGTDWATMQTLSLANQVNAYYALAFSNTYGGNTYSSISANGFIPGGADVGNGICWVFGNDLAQLTSQPWKTLPFVVYEGGSANNDYNGNQSAWNSMLIAVHRDSRNGYQYYDPTHQIDSTGTGYFTRMSAVATTYGTTLTINIFSDQNVISNEDYGCLESVMQPISPLSSAPPKYQGIANYAEA